MNVFYRLFSLFEFSSFFLHHLKIKKKRKKIKKFYFRINFRIKFPKICLAAWKKEFMTTVILHTTKRFTSPILHPRRFKENTICQRQEQRQEFYNCSVRPPISRPRRLITDDIHIYIYWHYVNHAQIMQIRHAHAYWPRNHPTSYCAEHRNEKKIPSGNALEWSEINRHLKSRYFDLYLYSIFYGLLDSA